MFHTGGHPSFASATKSLLALVKFTILKYNDDIINFLVHSTKKTRIGAC